MYTKAMLTILEILLGVSIAFSQSNSVIMKLGNVETEKLINQMKDKINSKLDNTQSLRKNLTSAQYIRGELSVYKKGDDNVKMTKEWVVKSKSVREDYYFSNQWPLYIEIKSSDEKFPDKFYFDKTNLTLWVTKNMECLHVDNKNCADRWVSLLDQIDKLRQIADMPEQSVNEDNVQLPKREEQPMSKADSVEFKKFRDKIEQFRRETGVEH